MAVSSWRQRIARSFLGNRTAQSRPAQPTHLGVLELETRCVPTVFLVTNTADGGSGSLRQAILDSNGSAGPNTINFKIPSGPLTIAPVMNLPGITTTVHIDGNSQPGSAGKPIIQLSGTGGATGDGLDIFAANCVIQGLTINGFSNGIAIGIIGSTATGNVIHDNYIGTDTLGTTAVPNNFGVWALLAATNNKVRDNLISGNTIFQVAFSGAGTNGNVAAGNTIGTDVTGTKSLTGNAINDSVNIFADAKNNTIGGPNAADRNLISGNTHWLGVALAAEGTGADSTSNNLVENNYIGTDITGTKAVPNAFGIDLFNNNGAPIPGQLTNNNTVRNNLISGNSQEGVLFSQAGTTNNKLLDNLIGTDKTGTKPLPNGSLGGFNIGVSITQGAQGNIIGTPGHGNIIAFNAGIGVRVGQTATDPLTIDNSIRGNSIFGNVGLGIDLGTDGVTPNHGATTATGPNDLQNYPVLSAATSGRDTRVVGTLVGLPGTKFTLDFYAAPAAVATSNAQGKRYLGSFTVTTDASGNVTFDHNLERGTRTGAVITATATDPNGNTSEFSAAITAIRPITVERVTLEEGAGDSEAIARIRVEFSGVVTLSPGAFTLVPKGGGSPVVLTVSSSVVHGETVAVLTLPTGGIGHDALSKYTLTINGGLVHDSFGQALDGDGNGLAGGNYVATLLQILHDADHDHDRDRGWWA